MLLLSFFAAIVLRRNNRKLFLASVTLLLISLFWTYQAQWVSTPRKDHTGNEHRLLFWNTCEATLGWPSVLAIVERHRPEFIVLAESETLPSDDAGLPRSVLKLPGRLLVASNRPAEHLKSYSLADAGICHLVQAETQTGTLFLLVVDIKSTVTNHRKAPIQRLAELAASQTGPVVIVGDFNTPVDSVFLQSIRRDFRNAFEVCGNGLHSTWPMPLPVVAIDQVWGNQRILFHTIQIDRTYVSDHCPIVCGFTIKERGATN